MFYSHVNYSVTKIALESALGGAKFYSHVNYSVTKILACFDSDTIVFYSHVNYSVTKMPTSSNDIWPRFTVT